MLGGNGAGKSTTLKTISGLMHPRSGSIEFDGQDVIDGTRRIAWCGSVLVTRRREGASSAA